MNSEIVSKIVGLLQFQVDVSGLQRFERGLAQTRQKMMALSREADVLSKKLGAKMGIKVDSAARDKLDKSVRASLDRELKLEQSLQRTKRATFAAELAGMKLTSAGNKENAALQGQVLRDKIGQAVLEAKSAKAAQERLKASGLEVKQAQSLEAHKLRQAKMEAVLASAQQRTVLLQQRQQANMTAMQRAELALQQSKTRAQRATEKHQASVIAQKVREERLATRTQQQTEKHGWATQRQAAWAAKQATPAPSTGFLGLGTGALALGGVTAGLAAIVGAVGMLSDRLTKTQTRVSDSQSWTNTIEQSGGKNPSNREFAKSEFLRISERFGTSVDLDAAKDYRTFLLHQMAVGKSISQATKMFETQMSAFRGAGMSKTEMQRANIQLTQVRAKGKGDTEDVNTFSEAAPLLVDPIKQAWKERNKYTGNDLEKAFRASFKVGNLKAVDFERGMEIFNQQNQPAILKQSQSIDSNQTRLENTQLLQQLGLDASPELIGAINDRIKAETELTEAMKPFKETMMVFDIGLSKLAASMLRLAAGRNLDGTEKSEQQQIQDRMSTNDVAVDTKMVGVGDYSAINGETQHQGGPIGKFYNWLFNVKDYSKDGEANKAKALTPNLLGMQFNKLDVSKFGVDPENIADGQYRQFRPFVYQPITADEMIDRAAQQQRLKEPVQPNWLGPGDLNGATVRAPADNVDQSTHTDVKVEKVEVNIDARGLSPDEIDKLTDERFRENWDKTLRTVIASQKENL